MIWWEAAACTDADAEMFFPVGTGIAARHDVAAAKAVCGRCDVRQECLSWALGMAVTGVWGGLSEPERRRVRRARDAAGTGSEIRTTGAHAAEVAVGEAEAAA